MEYQKLTNLLESTPHQLSDFRTKRWVETNDDTNRTYDTNIQIKFKTTILKSSLCAYSDTYLLSELKHGSRSSRK